MTVEEYMLMLVAVIFTILSIEGIQKVFRKKIKGKKIEKIKIFWILFAWGIGAFFFYVCRVLVVDTIIIYFLFLTAGWFGGWRILKILRDRRRNND